MINLEEISLRRFELFFYRLHLIWLVQDGRKYKLFYGMSSDTAMKKHHGSVAEYRASEGKTITIPYRYVPFYKLKSWERRMSVCE